jgi:hypothetical protein
MLEKQQKEKKGKKSVGFILILHGENDIRGK